MNNKVHSTSGFDFTDQQLELLKVVMTYGEMEILLPKDKGSPFVAGFRENHHILGHEIGNTAGVSVEKLYNRLNNLILLTIEDIEGN